MHDVRAPSVLGRRDVPRITIFLLFNTFTALGLVPFKFPGLCTMIIANSVLVLPFTSTSKAEPSLTALHFCTSATALTLSVTVLLQLRLWMQQHDGQQLLKEAVSSNANGCLGGIA